MTGPTPPEYADQRAHDVTWQTAEERNQMLTCSQCGQDVDPLAVFPGGLCLECWTPIGNNEARTMTADKLARMWGGK